jgi:hypothetical protein
MGRRSWSKSLLFGIFVASMLLGLATLPLASAVQHDTDRVDKILSQLILSANAHVQAWVDGYEGPYPYNYFAVVYHKVQAWQESTWFCTVYITYVKASYYHNDVIVKFEDVTTFTQSAIVLDELYENQQIGGWVGTTGYATFHYVIWPGSHYDTTLQTSYDGCKVHPQGQPQG